MSTRSDFFTIERKKTVVYSDFTDAFDKNPTTGFLAIRTNEEAVKQAVKNILLTNFGERFYDTTKGSNIRGSLFELVDEPSLEILKLKVIETIRRFEPRVADLAVQVHDDLNHNAFSVTVIFTIVNINTPPVNLTVLLQKVR